jgi:hypothetical protein
MNPNYMNRADLAVFGRHAATAVAEGIVSGLFAEQIESISAAIAEASEELAAADLAQIEARAAALETTRIAQNKRLELLRLLQNLKYLMKALSSGDVEFAGIGFDLPARERRIVTPQMPVELAVQGYSNGVNTLTFTGNNVPNSVVYMIEAKTEPHGPYAMIGLSRRQSFKHIGVIPGQLYQYRVRAQATRGMVSDWSNEAVVYRL